jgi:hypothetical protein
MSSARRRLEIEELGQRILPSGSPSLLPLPSFAPVMTAPQSHALAGQGSGTYTSGSPIADTGQTATLSGTADLARLGHVTVTGTITGLGNIMSGHASGILRFANSLGAVTVALLGPQQAGFSSLPQQFDYRMVSCTGAYLQVRDHGSLTITWQPAHVSPVAGSLFPVAHGTFTITVAGGFQPPPRSVSGIDGVAMIGPLHPASVPGVPDTRPFSGAIISIQPATGGAEIARVTTGADGKFTINVPPGRYRIVPLSGQPGLLPFAPPQLVVVDASHFTHVPVNYDTGIA